MVVEAVIWLLLSLALGLGTLVWFKLRYITVETREFRKHIEHLETLNNLLVHLIKDREEKIKLLQDRLENLELRLGSIEDSLDHLRFISSDIEMNTQARKSIKLDEIDQEVLDLKILVLYRQGYSIRQIAKELGLSKSTIHRRLKKLHEKAKLRATQEPSP